MNSVISRTCWRSSKSLQCRRTTASLSSRTNILTSTFPSTCCNGKFRSIHHSQPLDPNESIPDSISQLSSYIRNQQPELDLVRGKGNGKGNGNGNGHNQMAEEQSVISVAVPTAPPLVHVPLSYLHPLTKIPTFPQLPATIPSKIESPPKSFIPLSSHVFGITPRRDVLHSSVVYYLDAQRSGTASTKNRSDIKGSGRKLRPQKGSGRARLGTMSSPLLRGGGVAHGPHPKDHSTKLNRKMRDLALRSALSSKWRNGDLVIVKDLYWDKPPSSTGKLDKILKTKQWRDCLVLTAPRNPIPNVRLGGKSSLKPSPNNPLYDQGQIDSHEKSIDNFLNSCMNLPRVELIKLYQLKNDLKKNTNSKFGSKEESKKPGELHAYEVLKRKKLILDLGALEWLEERLGGAMAHEENEEFLNGLLNLEEEEQEQEEGNVEALDQNVNQDSSLTQAQAQEELQDELDQEVDEILERNNVHQESKVEKEKVAA